MPFFFVCAGVSAPATEATSVTLRTLFCYLSLAAYLVVIWILLIVRPLFVISGDNDWYANPFAVLLAEIPLHRTWFLYTLFTLRAILYPLFAANKYTLAFAFFCGALWTSVVPYSYSLDFFSVPGGLCCCCDTLNKTVHHNLNDDEAAGMVNGYVVLPLVESVYFFAGVGLQRSRLFSKTAALLERNPWVRLWGLVPLAILLVPAFIPPYTILKQRIIPAPSDEDWAQGTQSTGPLTLPLVLLVVLSIAALTPVSRLPLITDSGSRTMNGYLLGIHASGLMFDWSYTWALNFINPTVATLLTLFVFAPISMLWHTSELVAVAMWPIVQPTWAVALITGNPTSPPPTARRWASFVADCMGSKAPGWWARYGEWVIWVPLCLFYTYTVVLTVVVVRWEGSHGTSSLEWHSQYTKRLGAIRGGALLP